MPISAEQEALETQRDALEVHRYAAWGLIPENAYTRIKKLMEALREEFGGPEIEPHISIVGSTLMTEDEAIGAFNGGCNEVEQIRCKVETLETSRFYFQCVSLVIEITDDLKEKTRWFAGSCMPHLSLLYGTLTDEEKKRAKEKVLAMDPTITELEFIMSRVALYQVNFADRTQKSWVKLREGNLKLS
ncbi:PREDICTED: cyclic phosphodiesterase-like [Fragaria vesca subsp. vesca]